MSAPITAIYRAVRHLPTAEAARQLGKHYATVVEYRERHPEARYEPRQPPVARPGITVVQIPMAMPSSSTRIGGIPVMNVSLVAPPVHLNIDFARNGVKA